MAHQHVLMGAESNRARPIVRTIGLRDIKNALAEGIADFSAMPSHAVFLCVMYPIIGLGIAGLTLGYAMVPWFYPLAAGFALIGPVAAIGLYELSRRREAGVEVTASNAFDVVHSPSFGAIVALGFLLLTGPALAQSVGEKTGVNSALGISPTTADFVKEVAISDMFEIESNTLAQDKGNALEKKFAAQMVTDHTKTSTELKGLVSSGKVKAELPVALDGAHQGKLDKLRAAGGKDFSSAFDSMQVSAHRDAVSLFERYSKRGDNADLKNWAGKTLPALKHHLKMAQALKK